MDALCFLKMLSNKCLTWSIVTRAHVPRQVDLMRKCLLTGAIVLFGRGSVAQVTLALVLCFMFFALQMKLFPYRHVVRLRHDSFSHSCPCCLTRSAIVAI